MFSSSSSLEQMQYPFGMGRAMPGAGHRPWIKPNVEMAPNCPRCDSANTKFCYYNNYSLTQPRYFCKGCRRYWTKGGSLRNVPVGGGCRKNRHRGKSSSARTAANSEINYHSPRQITTNCAQLRPDLALDDMVGSSRHQSSSMVPPPDDDQYSSSSRDAASTIDLAALYSKFLNQGQFVPEQLAESYELGGAGSEGEIMGINNMGDQPGYDPFDVAGGGYESPLGMPDQSPVLFPGPGLSSWQEAPAGLCPFPGMWCDWSSLDHSSFGAF